MKGTVTVVIAAVEEVGEGGTRQQMAMPGRHVQGRGTVHIPTRGQLLDGRVTGEMIELCRDVESREPGGVVALRQCRCRDVIGKTAGLGSHVQGAGVGLTILALGKISGGGARWQPSASGGGVEGSPALGVLTLGEVGGSDAIRQTAVQSRHMEGRETIQVGAVSEQSDESGFGEGRFWIIPCIEAGRRGSGQGIVASV